MADVTLAAGQNRSDIDFSFAGSGSIGDALWLDLDGDGAQGPVEPGLPGVEVGLVWYGPDGVAGGGDDQSFTTVTDTDGGYGFDGLPAGTFSVTIITSDPDFPTGVAPSHDLDGIGSAGTTVVTLTTGQDAADADFGYTGLGSIGDTVWIDRDGDGTIDGAEPGIGAVPITVTWAGVDGTFGTGDDVDVATTTTPDGRWSVAGLPYGSVSVAVDGSSLPAGVVPTNDLDGIGTIHTATTTLSAGTPTRADADFGYRGNGVVGDTIWIDIDGDGIIDGGESGLAGAAVTVTLAGVDGILGSADDITVVTMTDGDGGYRVDGLPEGPLTVTITDGIPSDHVAISDPDSAVDGSWTGALGPDDIILTLDFGVRPDADLSVSKSHAEPFVVGESGAYTITIANAGPARATSVELSDVLPTGLRFVSATGLACSAADGTVTCGPVDLAAGAAMTVTLVVSIGEAAAPGVTNTVSVSSRTPDRNPSNDSDSDHVEVPLARLALSKQLNGALIGGQAATYRLTVSNEGPSSAVGVEVTDRLPPALSYQSFEAAENDGWTCDHGDGVVRCALDGELAVGQTTMIDLTVRVDPSATGTIANAASVSSSAGPAELSSAQASASGSVQPPALAFTGSSVRRLAAVGMILLVGGAAVLGHGRSGGAGSNRSAPRRSIERSAGRRRTTGQADAPISSRPWRRP